MLKFDVKHYYRNWWNYQHDYQRQFKLQLCYANEHWIVFIRAVQTIICIIWMGCRTRNSMDITMTTSTSVDSPSNRRSPVQTTAVVPAVQLTSIMETISRRVRMQTTNLLEWCKTSPKGNILIYFSIFCWKTVQISCIVKFKEKWQVIYYLARVHTICSREWAYVCLSIIDERRRRKVK